MRVSQSFILLGLLNVLGACTSTSKGSPTTMSGALLPVSVGVTIPDTATINVLGRDPGEFPVQFSSDPGLRGSFTMTGLPNQKLLVFEISGTGMDTTSTFPLLIGTSVSLRIPFLPSGTVNFFRDDAIAPGGVLNSFGVDLVARATVLGALNPNGGGCSPYVGVSLCSSATGGSCANVSQNGPFYPDANNGNHLTTGSFKDQECSYVIFNMPSGSFTLKALGSSQIPQTEVLTVAGKAFVGYGIPGS